MKNIIIIVFTIVLAVYIGTTYILGNGGSEASFQEVADQVGSKADSSITEIKDYSAGDASMGDTPAAP